MTATLFSCSIVGFHMASGLGALVLEWMLDLAWIRKADPCNYAG